MDQTTETPLKRLVTPESVWQQLGVSRAGLDRLIQFDPRAPRPIRIGRRSKRFLQRDVDQYIDVLAAEAGQADPAVSEPATV